MAEPLTATGWARRIIEGPAGLQEFERRELAETDMPPQVAAVVWALRCLGNPRCEGSEEVLEMIRRRREGAEG